MSNVPWRTALQSATRRIEGLPAVGPADWLYHEASSAVHGVLASAHAAEAAGATLSEMQQAMAKARRFHGEHSRTLAHTQAWPRGYPGDFELIERLMEGRSEAPPGSLDHALDSYILHSPIVAQHRAKVAWQAQLVLRRLREGARVLSIACGGSRDLMLLEPTALTGLNVVLTDLDGAALALSRSRMEGRVRNLTCIQGNALRLANRLQAAGPYDVIVAGGLLDYLPARAAQLLLLRAVGMLAPRGLLGVTNIARGNPWRILLELIAGWTLIERDEADMRGLLPTADDFAIEVMLDPTRLTWLMTVTKAPEQTPASATGHEVAARQ